MARGVDEVDPGASVLKGGNRRLYGDAPAALDLQEIGLSIPPVHAAGAAQLAEPGRAAVP